MAVKLYDMILAVRFMSKRFLLTLLTFLVIAAGVAVAVFIAKGYKILSNNEEKIIAGTGILSITSMPDQASVYLDGHLTTATNTNIKSLQPKTYEVRVVKEGFIPWQKKTDVKEGLVTEIKATLFRAIPSVYPLTYSGASNPSLSPDGQKIVFIVPEQKEGNVLERKKGGVWVWEMTEKPIAFSRGGGPLQIAQSSSGFNFTQAKFRWSPDSSQVLVSLQNVHLLLDVNRLNDPPRDVTAVLSSTTIGWDTEQKTKDLAKLELIQDFSLRKSASESAVLKWSPDETKFLYSKDGTSGFKIFELERSEFYDLPKADFYSWLPDSKHLVLIEGDTSNSDATRPFGKIAIIEYDSNNRAEIYVGNFELGSVFAWPDSSRLVVVSSIPTPTASIPNLFGINLK